jgi:hypothetical protein
MISELKTCLELIFRLTTASPLTLTQILVHTQEFSFNFQPWTPLETDYLQMI